MCVHSPLAQEKIPSKNSLIMVNFKLPKTLGNKSFRGLMSGLVDVEAVYQFTLKKGIGFGAGFRYSYFELIGSAFQGNVNGKLEGYNPFVKLAKRKTISEKSYMEFSLNAGYNLLNTTSNQCDDIFKQQAFNVMPQIGYYMISSEFLSFGIVVSYNYFNAEFSPANICATNFPGFEPASSVGNSHVFSVGFGFSTYLPTRK